MLLCAEAFTDIALASTHSPGELSAGCNPPMSTILADQLAAHRRLRTCLSSERTRAYCVEVKIYRFLTEVFWHFGPALLYLCIPTISLRALCVWCKGLECI